MNIKEDIKSIRKELELNQTDFGELLNKSHYVISDWETGRSEPKISDWLKIQKLKKKRGRK